MKLRLILGFVLLVLVLSFCKKDVAVSPKAIKNIYVSNTIKEWAFFGVGTYWIMRDSASTNIDSIYVTEVITGSKKFSYSNDTDVVAEEITIKIRCTFGFFEHILNSFNNDVKILTAPSKSVTVFSFDTTNVTSVIGDGINRNNVLSSYTVLSVPYSNVTRISYSYKLYGQSHGEYWITGKDYWKKNIGIIKKYNFQANPNASPYELLRYHIVQ